MAGPIPHHVSIGGHVYGPDHHRWHQHQPLLPDGMRVIMQITAVDDRRMVLGLYVLGCGPLSTAQLELHCWDLSNRRDHSGRLLYSDMGGVRKQEQAHWNFL